MNASIEDFTPKARRTRSALLDAARVELGIGGIARVTVMAVCERAGVGRTSFYNYFEDAGALISTVAQEAAKDIKEKFDTLHSDVPRGRDRLEACLLMILETATHDPETTLLVNSLANSIPEILELLHFEISAELAAFGAVPDKDKPVLVDHLTQTVLALAQQVALGNITKESNDKHVEFMMRSCG